MTNPLVSVLSAGIRWYQKTISHGFPRRCKYQPTCSQYSLEAIQIHGAFKGTLLSVWRILRCNPWSKGGVDWVPKPGKWPSKPLGYEELMAQRAKEDSSSVSSSDHGGHGDEETPEKSGNNRR